MTIIGHYFEGKHKLIVLSVTSVFSSVGGIVYPYILLLLKYVVVVIILEVVVE